VNIRFFAVCWKNKLICLLVEWIELLLVWFVNVLVEILFLMGCLIDMVAGIVLILHWAWRSTSQDRRRLKTRPRSTSSHYQPH